MKKILALLITSSLFGAAFAEPVPSRESLLSENTYAASQSHTGKTGYASKKKLKGKKYKQAHNSLKSHKKRGRIPDKGMHLPQDCCD